MRQAISNWQAVSKSHKSAGNIRSINVEEDDEAQTVAFPDNSEGDTVHQIHKPFNSNQKGNYLHDLDWDRPPPYRLCIQRKCLSGCTYSYTVNLVDHFLHLLDWD